MCTSSMAEASPILGNITSSLIPPQGHNHQKIPVHHDPGICDWTAVINSLGNWSMVSEPYQPLLVNPSASRATGAAGRGVAENKLQIPLAGDLPDSPLHHLLQYLFACTLLLWKRGQTVTWLKFLHDKAQNKGLINHMLCTQALWKINIGLFAPLHEFT